MFAKLAQFRAIGSSRAEAAPRRLVHSNDNRSRVRRCGPPPRIRRPILVCRWQPATGGGGLECRWSMELAEAIPGRRAAETLDDSSSDHPIDSPKEVDNVHHPRVQVRPRSRAPLWRTWSFLARELHPALLHQSLRTANGPSRCCSCRAVRGEISGAISGAPGARTPAAR